MRGTVPNRRNYYRVLHVQPDAPPEVVRAAYRALMARHHPDQEGGDHVQAVLLNEAWAVLGNATSRAEYDARRARAGQRHRTGAEARRESCAEQAPPPPSSPSSPHASAEHCAFCGDTNTVGAVVCARCTAPLARAIRPASHRPPSATGERRTLPRVSRADWGTVQLHWTGEPLDIRLRNLSVGGVSFYLGAPLAVGARVRVIAAAFDAVVEVVQCNRRDSVFAVQGAFVTVGFTSRGQSR
ncbi:MAG: J domain-containing protein [Gemmatimonas sp.]|nr:J domain-containing protein [Gemmatimonas sp.]